MQQTPPKRTSLKESPNRAKRQDLWRSPASCCFVHRLLCVTLAFDKQKRRAAPKSRPSTIQAMLLKRSCFRRSLSSLCCLDLLDQLGHDLEQIAHDAVVSHAEDGSTLVLVDSDDALGVLHTSSVLDSAGNAQSNIDLGVLPSSAWLTTASWAICSRSCPS